MAQAQTSFELRNKDIVSGINAPVFDWNGNRLWGPDWRVEVYGGRTADSLTPLVLFDSGERISGPLAAPGYFWLARSTGGIVQGSPPMGWVWLQVRVWNMEVGPNYEAAVGSGMGGFGQSPLFYALGGCPTCDLPEVPHALIGLQSFSVLQPVPELSTSALLAMGLAWLVYGIRSSRSGV